MPTKQGGNKTAVSVRLSGDVLAVVDQIAEQTGLNRTQVIELILRAFARRGEQAWQSLLPPPSPPNS